MTPVKPYPAAWDAAAVPAPGGGASDLGVEPPRYATSLLKSIDILEALGSDPEVSLAEISRRVGLSKPGVHRILATLASRGYVERVGSGGRYRLGIRAFELGARALVNRDVRLAARDVMRDLLAATGEVVNLSVPAGDAVVVLDQLIGPSLVQMRAQIGDRLPLDRTSSGRAYLVTLDPRELKKRYPSIVAEIDADRQRGYAIDDCLYQPDLRCVAAPIFDGLGAIAGIIGVSAPAYRVTLDDLTARIGPAVAQAARVVTARLGGGDREATRSVVSLRPNGAGTG